MVFLVLILIFSLTYLKIYGLMMKKIPMLRFLIVSGFLALFVSSTASSCCADMNYNSLFINLSLNGGIGSQGSTETFFLQPDVQKSYVPSGSKPTVFFAELFGGVQNPVDFGYETQFFWQLGLALAYSTNLQFKGTILEDANPIFENYSYKYDVTHSHFALKSKLFYAMNDVMDLYLSAGIGASYNQAGSFRISPLIFEEVPAPFFSRQSTTSSYYSIGVGAQYDINECWQWGLGYEFSGWGKSQLGRAPGQTVGAGLQVNNLYMNSINLNFTYVFA